MARWMQTKAHSSRQDLPQTRNCVVSRIETKTKSIEDIEDEEEANNC